MVHCIMSASPPLQYDESHLKVLRMLEANPSISQRELAETLGISLGKTNYCLKALIDKGWVKAQNFKNSRNKLGYAYLLTPSGIAQKAELTVHFLRRKVREYEALEEEIAQLEREVGGTDWALCKSTN